MSEPDRVTDATVITDHVARGLALLTDQWRGKPAVRAILSAWLAKVQEIEDTLGGVLAITIATGEGQQLDDLGAILGTARAGLTDTVYRRLLAGASIAIGSSGQGDRLLAALDAMSAPGDAFSLVEQFPAALLVEPEDAIDIPAAALHAVLRRGVAGGVRLGVIDVPEGDTFAFSDDDEVDADAARGFSNTGGLVGGQLVGVIV